MKAEAHVTSPALEFVKPSPEAEYATRKKVFEPSSKTVNASTKKKVWRTFIGNCKRGYEKRIVHETKTNSNKKGKKEKKRRKIKGWNGRSEKGKAM